jgi:hypothetical protein
MKTKILLIAILFFALKANSQTWQWTHPEPNGNLDYNHESDVAHDIETDASGNVYVLGDFWDSLFLNNVFREKASADYADRGGSYLAKYNSSGNLLWYKIIKQVSNYQVSIEATDLTVNDKGVFITGKYDASSYGDQLITYKIGNYTFNPQTNEIGFFITKFNTSGSVVWNKLGTGEDDLHSWEEYNPNITSDKNGNIISEFVCDAPTSIKIGGALIPVGAYNNAPNPDYLIVAKFTASGSLKWSNYAGGGFAVEGGGPGIGFMHNCYSIAADKNGNIFFYGEAYDSTFFGSHLLRIHPQDPHNPSTFLAKISSSGTWQFTEELYHNPTNGFLSSGLGNPERLAADDNGNVYASLQTNGNIEVILGDTLSTSTASAYLVKTNNNGKLIWHKFFGPTYGGNADGYSICIQNNNLYLSGYTNFASGLYYTYLQFSNLTTMPAIDGGAILGLIAKTDLNGNFIWVDTYGGHGSHVYANAIKVFNDNIYTCGSYRDYISTLGNLDGVYNENNFSYADNLFFGKLKDQYIRVGAITPTQLIPGCTISVPFTSYGLNFSGKNKFFAELSDANGDFTNATTIGNIKSKNSGAITATIPASLSYGSGYRIRIRSSDTLKTGYNYYAYADTDYALTLTCPPPSSGFASTNITATSATVNWTKVDCASGYRVQYRVKGTTKWTIAGTITNNNTTLFNLTGLTANTTYQWRVATRCKNNGAFSFSAYTTLKKFTTVNVFAAAVSNAIYADGKLVVTVLPNPASSNAILKINGAVKDAAIVITDVAGKTVWKADKINSHNILLPIAHFSAGVYLVKFTNGEEIKMIKLVKQ